MPITIIVGWQTLEDHWGLLVSQPNNLAKVANHSFRGRLCLKRIRQAGTEEKKWVAHACGHTKTLTNN